MTQHALVVIASVMIVAAPDGGAGPAPSKRVLRCSTGAPTTGMAVEIGPGGLPVGLQAVECVPSVVRDDGVDAFNVEFNLNGMGTSVLIEPDASVVGPGPSPIELRDDGVGPDRVAGDEIYTAGPFTVSPAANLPDHYWDDPTSPAGLSFADAGDLLVDGEPTWIALRFGVLRADVATAVPEMLTEDIQVTPHLVNVRTSDHAAVLKLSQQPVSLTTLTAAIYEVMPDRVDQLLFLAPELVIPMGYGIHRSVRIDFTGTGVDPFDDSASYGSGGRLQAVNVIRPLQGSSLPTHEISHQWGAYLGGSGLSDGVHYYTHADLDSVLGGRPWFDRGDGTWGRDCLAVLTQSRASSLDLYLMGLIDADEVPPTRSTDTSVPVYCDEVITDPPWLTVPIELIQLFYGPRVPGPDQAQRDFAIAFVVASHERLLTPTEMTYHEILAAHYTSPVPPGAPDPPIHRGWNSIARYWPGTTWSSVIPRFGDADGDGDVDVDDLVAVITAWGDCPPAPQACPADLDGDGDVDVDDLVEVIVSWPG